MHRLEVDGDVVDGTEETTSKHEGEGAHDEVGSFTGHAGRHHGSLTRPPLEENPSSDDEGKADEETDDDGGVPGVGDTTELDGEEVADDGTHDQGDTRQIHLAELLEKRGLLRDSLLGGLEEEQNDGGRDTTDGKVDVEAPSPAHMVSEGTAEKGTDDTSETVRGADDTGEGGSLGRRRGEGNDGVGTGAETCSTQTGNGTAGDQSLSGGGGTANDGAEFEDENGDEERSLEREELVNLAPWTILLAK